MTTTRENAKGLADRHSNAASLFVRLQDDGDKVVGAFVGQPHAREVHWTGTKYDECAGSSCAHCRSGARPSFRVLFNLYVDDNGDAPMRVIEGGTTFFAAVLAMRERCGLDGWFFEVQRVGRAKDPKTTYAIRPERPIDAQMAARIASVSQHDLARLGRA
jgi:hypothetical protein